MQADPTASPAVPAGTDQTAALEPPRLLVMLEQALDLEPGSLPRLLRSLSRGTEQRVTWTVPEAAAALGIKVSTAYSYVESGDLPSIKLRGRLLIPCKPVIQMVEQAIERWRSLRRAEGGSDAA